MMGVHWKLCLVNIWGATNHPCFTECRGILNLQSFHFNNSFIIQCVDFPKEFSNTSLASWFRRWKGLFPLAARQMYRWIFLPVT